jgi:hypothetical protein
MGALLNSCLFLLGMAVLVLWSRADVAGCQSRGRVVSLMGGLGVLAFTLSAISPDDDLLQHESIRPAAQSPGAIRYVGAAPPVLVSSFPVNSLLASIRSLLLPEASASLVALRRVPLRTLRMIPISIHSPPLPPGSLWQSEI